VDQNWIGVFAFSGSKGIGENIKIISSSLDVKSSRKPCQENFNQTLIDFFHQLLPEMVGG